MILESNTIYELGKDIPYGWYGFFTDGSYTTFPSTSGHVAVNYLPEKNACSYRQHSDYYFTVNLTPEKCKFIEILGGKGRYYDHSPFSINKLVLQSCNTGIIFEDELFKVEILSKSDETYRYDGPYPIDVAKHRFFKVNDLFFFIGQFDFTSLEMYHSIELGYLDPLTQSINKINTERLPKLSDKDKYPFGFCLFAKVDDSLIDYTNLFLVEANGQKLFEKLVPKSNAIYYKDETDKLYQLLNLFKNEIHKINTSHEIELFDDCMDLIPIVNKALEHLLQKREEYKEIEKSELIEYIIKPFYDKSFYEMAVLSNNAEDIVYDKEADKYHVYFNSTQVYEIELMTFINKYSFLDNNTLIEVSQNKDIVRKYSYLYYEINYLDKVLADIRRDHGYSGKATGSILLRLIKEDKKELRKRANHLYKIAKESGLVISKWSNEYRLFALISRYVKNVIYQYRADWLDNQSIDVFIEDQKIAIEYQGRQHYEPVEHFGGETSYYDNLKRDYDKKNKCIENDVTLIEWNYENKVNKYTVLEFLKTHNIIHSDLPLDDFN